MAGDGSRFWVEALAVSGSATPRVLPTVAGFGVIAAAAWGVAWLVERWFGVQVGLEVGVYELAGAALGLLLILRTNSGYDRWWEARKLWGGMVNQCRNLAAGVVAHGPADAAWRAAVVRWAAAFPHVARGTLRGEGIPPEVGKLVGGDEAARLAGSPHPPTAVAVRLGELLRDGCERLGMDRFAFVNMDRERALLIDHIGACERILKTPLPRVYAIKIRRFIALFLVTLPFALLHRMAADWMVPLVTMLVAYPLVGLDRIGVELQNPFAKSNLSHLPLDAISATIEGNLLGLLPPSGDRRSPA